MILDCIPHGEEGAEALFEVEGDDATRRKVIEAVKDHPDILGLQLANDSDGKTMASVVARNWVACRTILKSDCYLRGARTLNDGKVEWFLLVKDERSLAKLLKELRMADCEAEILQKIAIREPFALTNKQESVMKAALELGYYDHPRKITGRELSKKLGVSPSTLSEILQRTERKLAVFYLSHRI